MWTWLAGCSVTVPPPSPPAAGPVSVCEAVAAHAAYVEAHPEMAAYADVLAFATPPYEAAEGCTLSPRDQLRLEPPPAGDPPCPPGSEPWTRTSGAEVETACVGPMAAGDGSFLFADAERGLYFTGHRTVRDGGRLAFDGTYEGGRARLEREWDASETGVPLLRAIRTFDAEGRAVSEEWLDPFRRYAVRVEFASTAVAEITWLATGPSTSVRIARTDRPSPPRIVREVVLTDGVETSSTSWIADTYGFERLESEFRARPAPPPPRPCPRDDSVVGGDAYHLDKWVWTRTSRAEIVLPPGISRVRFPSNWGAVSGGEAGRIDVLVRHTRERLERGRPMDPCDWTDAGLRARREGDALALWSVGGWEAELDGSSLQAVLVLPDGVAGVEDPTLYTRSEAATAEGGDGQDLALRPDPGAVVEVFGPLLAQQSAHEVHEVRKRLELPVYDRSGTLRPRSPPYHELAEFRVSSPRQGVADGALAVLRLAEPDLLACFDELMRVAPTATGAVKIALSHTPEGEVEFVDLISWPVVENRLVQRPALVAARERADRCIGGRLRAVEFFPDPDGRDVVVNAELTLPNAPLGFGRTRERH